MGRVRDEMGWDFANALEVASSRVLVEAEDRAVERHGRQIMQMISGTRYQLEGMQAPSPPD